jgi:hypothetical protein
MRLPWLKPADGASRKGLRRELIAALAIKLLALLALWLLFFSRPAIHDMSTGMAPDRVAAAVVAPAAAPADRPARQGTPQ